MTEFTFTITDIGERIFVEQALAMYREMNRVACEAPDGQVLGRAEKVALEGGRDLIRGGLETVLNAQAREVEKKGRRNGTARSAGRRGDIEDAGDASIGRSSAR